MEGVIKSLWLLHLHLQLNLLIWVVMFNLGFLTKFQLQKQKKILKV